MAHQIKFRRDTANNFTSNNPTLAAGEPGYETDTGKIKVGDGTTAWTSLAYLVGASGSVTSVDSGAGLTGGPVTVAGTLSVGAGTGITVNADSIEVDLSPFSTSDLSEGTNLYYTDAKVDARLSSGSVATITTTGDITTAGFFEGDLNGAVTIDVYNNTAGTLDKGKAVYLTGTATGDNPHVEVADNTNAATMPAVGIIHTNLSAGGVGQVVTSGIMNFTSHGLALGADLYINGSGGLTTTIPTGESNLLQKIGKVVNANQIIVQGAFRTNATPNLNNGNVFIGNGSNQSVAVTLDTSIVPENTNLYYTDSRFDTRFATKDTGDLTEGSNLYHTTARARGAISATGDISYDSGTGVISFTGSGAPVDSVNGATGVVVLDTDDISEGATNKYLSATNVLATDMTLKQFSETVNVIGNTSGSVTIDHNLGSIHTLTLTGAITQLAFSNLATGESGMLVLTQDVTGSHTFASTNMIFAGGAPTLTTAGGSIDVISYVSDGTNVLASFSGEYKA
jgi:hypothetical protein